MFEFEFEVSVGVGKDGVVGLVGVEMVWRGDAVFRGGKEDGVGRSGGRGGFWLWGVRVVKGEEKGGGREGEGEGEGEEGGRLRFRERFDDSGRCVWDCGGRCLCCLLLRYVSLARSGSME